MNPNSESNQTSSRLPADSPDQSEAPSDEVVELLDNLTGETSEDENRVTHSLLDIFGD